MHRLLDASPDGYAVVRGGEIHWANAGLACMAGIVSADLRGRAWAQLFADRGFGLPRGVNVIECGLLRNGLEPIPVSVDWIPARAERADAGGDEAYLIRDLRMMQTLEEEVLRSGRRLHAANRELASLRERAHREGEERDDLLTVLSHELRTPVTVITGYNRLLLAGEVGGLTEKQRHFLCESQKSCQRLDQFLENLIEAAGKGVATGPLEVREGSIEALLEEVAGMLGPLLRDRALRVTIRCAPTLPRVRFDPRRFEQVLVNLLNNASRFAPPDTEIAIEAAGASRGGREGIQLTVSDRGPGIAREDRERVFEPYVQGESSRQGGGLGIGLTICRRIVEAHGGEIEICTEYQEGARLVLWIPAMVSSLEDAR